MIDYNKSIVLVGPVGTGKSLVGRAISKKLNMQLITADEFRHLPTMIEIDRVLSRSDLSPRERDRYERYSELRQRYPDVRNYSQFGFKPRVSEYLEKTFGKVAWHYYQKQFENMLIADICDKVHGAVILDTGGGMPISMDDKYNALRERFESIDSDLFYREFPRLDMIGKSVTHDIYHRFDNVVYLKLPDNIMDRSDRSQNDSTSQDFVESGDYERVATMSLDTTGLYNAGRPDIQILDRVVENIVNVANIDNEHMGE